MLMCINKCRNSLIVASIFMHNFSEITNGHVHLFLIIKLMHIKGKGSSEKSKMLQQIKI